jgi:hypothetical protein
MVTAVAWDKGQGVVILGKAKVRNVEILCMGLFLINLNREGCMIA